MRFGITSFSRNRWSGKSHKVLLTTIPPEFGLIIYRIACIEKLRSSSYAWASSFWQSNSRRTCSSLDGATDLGGDGNGDTSVSRGPPFQFQGVPPNERASESGADRPTG